MRTMSLACTVIAICHLCYFSAAVVDAVYKGDLQQGCLESFSKRCPDFVTFARWLTCACERTICTLEAGNQYNDARGMTTGGRGACASSAMDINLDTDVYLGYIIGY